ncbi:CD209 antigen-like protein E isoform X5 [Simochromis diagramma]|uniref:CD209 antigen-like protein E isoform X5 n=1 Tax=Simochromis diagramma TaxID=43689 RepID=UPI001A7E7B49|nr:CD209 antigen-like protein E isoform X5 [Simochromis diagramma]XP_039876057.1 CD209 antigen-like protein E isoform X5 [Simochromis diagramma]XP_039876058.1 CD209 antigen-like protein E isoform X5 [Simochromis diagramma]
MMSRPQSFIEGEAPDSRHEKSNRGSKVTTERVALVVLCILLAAALIVIYRLSFDKIRTNKQLENLKHHKMKCENNLTETLSKIKPCITVQPTCPVPKVIDDPCYKCEEGWELHGGKCYYFSTSKSSWEQSRDECRAKGGELVKIDSREEQRFLDRRLRNVMTEDEDRFWIGLTDSAVEGRWVWADGSPLDQSLTFWSKGEPDNWTGHNGEHPDGDDCVRMGEKGGADDLKCWFDAFCSKPHRSICEKAGVKGQFKKVCD